MKTLFKMLRIEDGSTFIITLLSILIIWVFLSIPLTMYFHKDSELSGRLGDTFGILNSLFSSLAFGGLVYTILVQKKELRETRDEFKIQNATLRSQRFENTYFNLLTFHRQTIESLSFKDAHHQQHRGYQVFLQIRSNIQRFLIKEILDPNSDDYQSKIERIKINYNKTVNAYFLESIEMYLGSLIAILEFLRDTNLIETQSKDQYYSILERSLSRNEMRLLFYHFTLYNEKSRIMEALIALEASRYFIFKQSVPLFHPSHIWLMTDRVKV